MSEREFSKKKTPHLLPLREKYQISRILSPPPFSQLTELPPEQEHNSVMNFHSKTRRCPPKIKALLCLWRRGLNPKLRFIAEYSRHQPGCGRVLSEADRLSPALLELPRGMSNHQMDFGSETASLGRERPTLCAPSQPSVFFHHDPLNISAFSQVLDICEMQIPGRGGINPGLLRALIPDWNLQS